MQVNCNNDIEHCFAKFFGIACEKNVIPSLFYCMEFDFRDTQQHWF